MAPPDDGSRLNLGNPLEEIREFLLSPFTVDEYREQMLQLQARQTQILEDEFGTPGSGLPLVGGVGQADITNAAALRETPVPPDGFEQTETPEDVTIAAGDSDTVISVTPQDSALWYEVGTTDHTYSEYTYVVDGGRLFENPLLEPLGLYNDTYRFPQPVIVRSEIEVQVARGSAAGGSADYFSKVRTVPISSSTADALEQAWESL